MRRPDALDEITSEVRALVVQELGLTDDDLSIPDSLIRDNETHAAFEMLRTETCHEGIIWPDHLVKQFRELPERFDLGREFDEFMKWQDEIRAKKNATASEPVS
ncbi:MULTISPECIES: hypothetical protein [unclassified Brevibacterium]|uniref:hypothetical protein n=1 Tax=unclassified Brevibacterium TaxID=2614124 RepID=UPI0008A4DBA0|nr:MULTISPECIES: hypothetical protein [unclassified Brevibacterium]OFL67239.1 hypothetical protein HMPREF2757_11090 [Brevibacterium sp. HMSC063G07]OFS26707.1 hypothetical protein HMPREF3162_04595 [Brevibacterium sp. HMSC07C04]